MWKSRIDYVETVGKQPESLAFNLITYLLITKKNLICYYLTFVLLGDLFTFRRAKRKQNQ